MNSVTLWTGPVNGANVRNASVAGSTPRFLTCTGDGKPSCGAIAEGARDAEGRMLPQLLARVHADRRSDVYGAAFSAGGHLWRRVCGSAADRAALRGLLLCDGTYTTERRGDGTAAPIEGFVVYALECIASGRAFIATASSSPNKTHPTGAETLWAIVDELERRGVSWSDARADMPWSPARAVRSGRVMFADYGARYTHVQHATLLGPELVGRLAASDPPARPVPRAAQPENDAGIILVLGTLGLRAMSTVWSVAKRRRQLKAMGRNSG